jgi:hypothetical protein
MSTINGQHGWQLRGEEYPELYVTQHTTEWYTSNGGSLGVVSQEVIQNLDANINFADYDKFDPNDIDHDGNFREPDGEVDMLILWFRWLCSGIETPNGCGGYSGVAALGGACLANFPNGIYTTNDLINVNGVPTYVKINPGVTGSGLLGEGTSPNGINIFAHEVGHFIYGTTHFQHAGVWNMMTGNGVGIMNNFERSYINWSPPSININTAGTYNINLTDFETTGKSYKIFTQNGTYTLENRGTNGFYSTRGNWVMPANGLLITRNDYADIMCADHRWIWKNYGTADCSYCNNSFGLKFKFPFERDFPNNSGQSEMNMRNVCTYDGINNVCRWHDGACGNAGDIWNIGYNQVFSTWSNPNTENALNNQSITIDFTQRNIDGSVDIVLKYGDPLSYVATHPSKPMWLRATPYYFDPNFPHKFHPQLQWYLNSEPDMNTGNAKYEIYRGGPVTGFDDEPSSYDFLAVVPYDQNTYLDETVSLYDGGSSLGCAYLPVSYWYKIVAVDNESLPSVMSEHGKIGGWYDPCENQDNPVFSQTQKPGEFKLFNNYPNPFNPTTMIKYAIPKYAFVKITVFDILGREITTLTNEYKTAGYYEVRFDGTNLASGLYFYRIEAGAYVQTKKMLLLK